VTPIYFPGVNIVLGENQKEYLALPALMFKDQVISYWKLTVWERFFLLFTGKLWLLQLHFGHPMQPQKPQVTRPFKDPVK